MGIYMNKLIKIVLEYHGYFVDITGVKNDSIIVSQCPSDGINEIKQYIKKQYGIHENFMIVVNVDETSKVLLSTNKLLEENDIIKVIPISSGG